MRSYFVLRLFPTSYQFLGPFSEEDLRKEMKRGRISLSDLAYTPDDPGRWRRLHKFDYLMECQPSVPGNDELIKFEDEAAERLKQIVSSKKKAAKLGKPSRDEILVSPMISKEKIWYLQSQGAEFGPFSFIELGKIFDSGKLVGKIYAWKEGLVNWMVVASLEQLLAELPQAERSKVAVIERGSNQRLHTRSTFIATVSIQVEGETHSGLCLDISEGGLQVGKWTAEIKLNEVYSTLITPLGLTGIGPFTAESQVIWVNEKLETTGFQFKGFKKSSDQKLLLKYLRSSQS
jgi:hypothetical protein